MSPYALNLKWPVADVLAWALLQAIDDLEARAVVAEHHDAHIGPVSAAEYRTDIDRLRTVLDQIAPGARLSDSSQAVVRWIEGTWAIVDGHPVRLIRQDEFQALLESSLDLVSQHLLDPHDALSALQHLVANDLLDHATSDHFTNPIHGHAHSQHVQATTDPQAPSLSTPQAAHRLAPGCKPRSGPVVETGAERC